MSEPNPFEFNLELFGETQDFDVNANFDEAFAANCLFDFNNACSDPAERTSDLEKDAEHASPDISREANTDSDLISGFDWEAFASTETGVDLQAGATVDPSVLDNISSQDAPPTQERVEESTDSSEESVQQACNSPLTSQEVEGNHGESQEHASQADPSTEAPLVEFSNEELNGALMDENARLKAMLSVMSDRLTEAESARAPKTPPQKAPPKRRQTTPRKRPVSRANDLEVSPSKKSKASVATPVKSPQDTPQGPIEALWSPGVTPAQRRALCQQLTSPTKPTSTYSGTSSCGLEGPVRNGLNDPSAQAFDAKFFSQDNVQVDHVNASSSGYSTLTPPTTSPAAMNNTDPRRQLFPQVNAESVLFNNTMYYPAANHNDRQSGYVGSMCGASHTSDVMSEFLTSGALQSATSSPCASISSLTSPATNKKAPAKKPRATPTKRTPAAKKTTNEPKAKATQPRQRNMSMPALPTFTGVEKPTFTTPQAPRRVERPMSELYTASFNDLTQEEKARILLPLLQGLDPVTGEKLGGSGGMVKPAAPVVASPVAATLAKPKYDYGLSHMTVDDVFGNDFTAYMPTSKLNMTAMQTPQSNMAGMQALQFAMSGMQVPQMNMASMPTPQMSMSRMQTPPMNMTNAQTGQFNMQSMSPAMHMTQGLGDGFDFDAMAMNIGAARQRQALEKRRFLQSQGLKR